MSSPFQKFKHFFLILSLLTKDRLCKIWYLAMIRTIALFCEVKSPSKGSILFLNYFVYFQVLIYLLSLLMKRKRRVFCNFFRTSTIMIILGWFLYILISFQIGSLFVYSRVIFSVFKKSKCNYFIRKKVFSCFWIYSEFLFDASLFSVKVFFQLMQFFPIGTVLVFF